MGAFSSTDYRTFPRLVCAARTRLAFQLCPYSVSTLGRRDFAKGLAVAGRISSSPDLHRSRSLRVQLWRRRHTFSKCRPKYAESPGGEQFFLTQYPGQLPTPLPIGSCHYDYVPFSAVLPHVAVLVNHGGIGTTAQAIAAGLPQLMVPSTHDQPDNAIRVRRLGVGDFLLPKAYTSASVDEKLRRLMGPDVRKNCQGLASILHFASFSGIFTMPL